MPQPQAYMGGANKLFDANCKLINDGTRKFLQGFIQAYAAWAVLLREGSDDVILLSVLADHDTDSSCGREGMTRTSRSKRAITSSVTLPSRNFKTPVLP